MRRFLLVLFLLAGTAVTSPALDRRACTVTRYQLEVQIDRTSHVIAVTGKVTLRNDSSLPQKNIALQVSSSLAWNAILLDGKPLQWLGENYTSDIDHTGSLSEAIVTLPKELAPGNSVTLDIQYGGTITPDSTRLTRMGAPDEVAARNDWDQISDSFTAVRGLGYVVWYPVAIEAVSMSEGNSVFDAIAAWKEKQAHSEFDARIIVLGASTESLCIAVNTAVTSCGESRESSETPQTGGKLKEFSNTLTLNGLRETTPAFAIANYQSLDRPTVSVMHLPDDTQLARDYALAAEANDPVLRDWLGEPGQPARIIELSDPNANPYQSGAILFTPLREAPTASLQLLLMPTQVATRFHSPHAWIQEGMERFMQTVLVDSRSGRKAALDFLDEYREPLMKAEEMAHPKAETASKEAAEAGAANNTLLNTNDELYLRGKGSFVMWMLRDMVGDTAMQSALAAYHPGADKNPSYLQRLVANQLEARSGVVLRRLGLSRSRAAGLSRGISARPHAAERGEELSGDRDHREPRTRRSRSSGADAVAFRRESHAGGGEGGREGNGPDRGAGRAGQSCGQRWQRAGSECGQQCLRCCAAGKGVNKLFTTETRDTETKRQRDTETKRQRDRNRDTEEVLQPDFR